MASWFSRRGFAGPVKAVHLDYKFFRPGAELRRQFYFESAAGLAIENGTARDRLAQHFFKTERLRAKLNQVAIVGFTPAAFVFDRKWFRAKLDDISTASDGEAAACERKAADGAKIMPSRLTGKIGFLVEQPSLRGEAILRPCLLKADQGPLTRAEGKMLQSAQRQSILRLQLD